MRLFRFSLLKIYFGLIENKNKALKIINIGIFLSIFASTSAIITYFIEKQINEKEFLLIEEQFQAKDNSSIISEFESIILLLETYNRSEFMQTENAFFLSWTTLGSKIISENDFYAPIIYTALKDTKELDRLFELGIEGQNFSESIVKLIEDAWDKDEVDKTKEIFKNFEKSYETIKKIDINFYKSKIYNNSPELLFDEVSSKKNNSLDYNSNSKIFSDYSAVYEYKQNTIIFFKRLHMILRATLAQNHDSIKKLNNEIIDLSKKENRLIFLTFIFQLIAFMLIQIFEISSMNIYKKEKL